MKIITGDLKDEGLTTIRIESRRLLFEKIRTEAGKFRKFTATVNLRVPQIANSGEEVVRKPREQFKLDWDNKLTFEFTDKRPCICALEIIPVYDAYQLS